MWQLKGTMEGVPVSLWVADHAPLLSGTYDGEWKKRRNEREREEQKDREQEGWQD